MRAGYEVVIVGGGASGTLVACQLMRQARAPLRVGWVDAAGAFARGVAYGTREPEHLLNVPAARMSALPEDGAHFVRWLQGEGLPYDAHSFVPRRDYARYLASLLEEARAAAAPGVVLEAHRAAVQALREEAEGVVLTLAGGEQVHARAVVLALGNGPPATPAVPDGGLYASGRWVRSPWRPGALEGLEPEAHLLLVGSGLTAVDVLLSLQARGHRGPVHLLSRRGLLPRVHVAHGLVSRTLEGAPWEAPAPSLRALVRALREEVARAGGEGGDWREVVDGLRPHTARLWQGLTPPERRRFLVHLRAWWDAHRHRMAPEVAVAVEALRARGQLVQHAGRLLSFGLEEGRVVATFRPRGEASPRALRVDAVINCTGPSSDVRRGAEGLLGSLLAQGLACADACGLGLQTRGGALVDAHGRPAPHLFVLGPMRRAELWETTAVPEIREQAAEVATRLLAEMGTGYFSGCASA